MCLTFLTEFYKQMVSIFHPVYQSYTYLYCVFFTVAFNYIENLCKKTVPLKIRIGDFTILILASIDISLVSLELDGAWK